MRAPMYIKVRELPHYPTLPRTWALIHSSQPGFEPGRCQWPSLIRAQDRSTIESIARHMVRTKPYVILEG